MDKLLISELASRCERKHTHSVQQHIPPSHGYTEPRVCVCVSLANHNRKTLSGSQMSAAAPQTRAGQLITIRPH